jgi:hypothetical protein
MKVMGPLRDEPSAAPLAPSRQRPPLWVAVDVPALALQAWRLTLPEALQGAPLALLKGVRLGAVNE